MRRRLLFALAVVGLSLSFLNLSAASLKAQQQIVITEDNLLKQVGKVPDSFLITVIGKASKINIADPQTLKGRVSSQVIDALVQRKAELAFSEPSPASAAAPSNLSPAPAVSSAYPTKEGVYWKSPSGWTLMEAAPSGEQGGSGFGLGSNPFRSKKGGMKIRGPEASIKTGLKPQFCLVGSFAESSRDVMLIKLDKDGHDRLVSNFSVGGFHTSRTGSFNDTPSDINKDGDVITVAPKSEMKVGEYAVRVGMSIFDFSVRN